MVSYGYRKALRTYIEATNTHKFSNVEKVLHPEAVYFFTDATCRGYEEIGAYFNQTWNLIKEEVYSASEVEWIAISEEMATCTYTYTYEGYLEEEFISGKGRATNVFSVIGSEWKLIHEHLSGSVKSRDE
ncbi:nuclear transport factor 2 family protein [Bacillus sp. JCM 19041]|uniref:YybH family protein n=1 Tax=Bacillus sp. JCM 19041 TaxID=1460637 RepID=UPI0006D0E86A